MMTCREIHIREASSDDIPVLSGLVRNAYADVAGRFDLTHENCPKHPSNCRDEWIENDLKRRVRYYKLVEDGITIGCAAIEQANNEQCYLERLSVLPEYRQKGFGELLVNHIFNQARALNAKNIGIGIISKQTELKAWYKKIGFVERETKEFPHLPFSVTFMTHELQYSQE